MLEIKLNFFSCSNPDQPRIPTNRCWNSCGSVASARSSLLGRFVSESCFREQALLQKG